MSALTISQAVQGADALFLFQLFFGGSISVHAPETGLLCAFVRWVVYGDTARRSAQMLSRAKLGKQRQLALFARGLQRAKGRQGAT